METTSTYINANTSHLNLLIHTTFLGGRPISFYPTISALLMKVTGKINGLLGDYIAKLMPKWQASLFRSECWSLPSYYSFPP